MAEKYLLQLRHRDIVSPGLCMCILNFSNIVEPRIYPKIRTLISNAFWNEVDDK